MILRSLLVSALIALSSPTHAQSPAERIERHAFEFATAAFRSYVCTNFVNYYAVQAGVKEDIVYLREGEGSKLVFGNRRDQDVCGHIEIKSTEPATVSRRAFVRFQLSEHFGQAVAKHMSEARIEAEYLATHFLPPSDASRPVEAAAIAGIRAYIDAYGKTVLSYLEEALAAHPEGLDWETLLPVASGPNLGVLHGRYRGAKDRYAEFERWFETNFKR